MTLMKNRKMWLSKLTVIIMLSTVVAGCLKNGDIQSNETKVLKILGYEYEVLALSRLFEVTHDVEIEVIDVEKLHAEAHKLHKDPEEYVKEVIKGPDAPDLIFLRVYQLREYIDEGLLVQLDHLMTSNQFDITSFAPIVREGLLEQGNGNYYVLTPSFNTEALFYNKSIFDRMNVPYPTDGMTWEEIFNLARLLTHEEDGEMVYGLEFDYGDMSYQFFRFASQAGRSPYNVENNRLELSDSFWGNLWNQIIELYKEKAIAPEIDWDTPSKYGPYDPKRFIIGKAAMSITSTYTIVTLSNFIDGDGYRNYNIDHFNKFEWDVVSVPIMPEAPDVGGRISYGELIGISSYSHQTELAWQYLSFIHSEKVAKSLMNFNRPMHITSHTNDAQLQNQYQKSMGTILSLKPIFSSLNSDFHQRFKESPGDLIQIANEEMNAALLGEKSSNKAFKTFEMRGQELLDRKLLERELKMNTN